MKAAPILRAIREHNDRDGEPAIKHLLVHTGQHYDEAMSERFFSDLGLPKPDIHLGVGSGSQDKQTAEILLRFTEVLARECPEVIIVVGDVNSTLACALATAKMTAVPGKPRPLIAHVEAGLRSFDREMPEEINRVVTDHLADLLFVTEKSGVINLRREGVPGKKIFFVGNTMIDSLVAFRERADESPILETLGLRACFAEKNGKGNGKPYALLTLHRPSNVDDPASLREILEGLSVLSDKMEIIFPVHPRTRKRIEEFGVEDYFQNNPVESKGIRRVDPLGYIDFLCLMKNARLVLTDSGGIQEETTCLGIPCVTLRENTERPVTVKHGTNIIAGTSSAKIRRAIARQLSRKTKPCIPEKWDGKAARRIVPILESAVGDQFPASLGNRH